MRNFLVFAGCLVVAICVDLTLAPRWLSMVIAGHIFTTSIDWFDPLALTQWAYDVLLLLVFGALLALLIRGRWTILWAAGFGLCLGTIRMVLAHNEFLVEPTLVRRVWVYGEYYLAAPVAAACSAWIVRWALRRRQHAA